MLHLNYSRILPHFVPACSQTPGWQLAAKKLALDQLAFAPVCTSGFFIVINLLELNGLSKGVNDMRQKLWPTMLINW